MNIIKVLEVSPLSFAKVKRNSESLLSLFLSKPTDRSLKIPKKRHNKLQAGIKYGEPIPMSYTDLYNPRDLRDRTLHLIQRLKYIFSIRPVWLLQSLKELEECKNENAIILNLLPHVAYYVKSGPWMNCWIRYGYDPSVHREACIYQTITLQRSHSELKNVTDRCVLYSDIDMLLFLFIFKMFYELQIVPLSQRTQSE
jgi:hypothetical protein